jgi:YlmC/YmxH family sporulation protein
MLKLSDIREKEVINLFNGQRMGYITDFEINLENGTLTGIVLSGESKVMSFFTKANDIYVEWSKIIKIGNDTILINYKDE